MKISEITRNLTVIEAGRWVSDIPGLGDVELKTRGKDNADWRRLESALIASVPRSGRVNGRLTPAEADRVTGVLLRDAALLDWRNVTDNDGNPIPFSKDAAAKFLLQPEFRGFRDAVLWAAISVAEDTAAGIEDTTKN